MSDVYTREELDKLSRVELRTLAVQKWGMNNRECSMSTSDTIKDYILEKQDNGGGGDAPAEETKPKGRAPKSNGKAVTPRGRTSKVAKADEKSADMDSNAAGDLSTILEKLDALGKGMDEEMAEVKQLVGDVRDIVVDVDRKLFITFGLVTDLFKLNFEPSDLDERVEELQKEYEGN